MKRRILTFTLVPALSGFLATILFLMQEGFGTEHGSFELVIGFFELPSILLVVPASDMLPLPAGIRDHSLLLVIGIGTLINSGLFALAGFISWTWTLSLPPRTHSTAGDMRFFFAPLYLVLGQLIEAVFGWLLLVLYGFASMHGPGVRGMKRLILTLEKMLDPRDAFWGTLLFVAGILGGLMLIFTGCTQLSKILGRNTPAEKSATPSLP